MQFIQPPTMSQVKRKHMEISSTKLTNHSEADQFRKEAILFIGKVVKSRGYCLKRGIGKPVSREKFNQVKASYYAYRFRWKTAGIAWFIVRRQEDILDLLPGGQKEVEKFIELLEQSKKYAV
jgi:hypothetical protein